MKKLNERGAGRKKKYNEETVALNIRVPMSEKENCKKMIWKYLESKSSSKKPKSKKSSSTEEMKSKIDKSDSKKSMADAIVEDEVVVAGVGKTKASGTGSIYFPTDKNPNITMNNTNFRYSAGKEGMKYFDYYEDAVKSYNEFEDFRKKQLDILKQIGK